MEELIQLLDKKLRGKTVCGVHAYTDDVDNPSDTGIGIVLQDSKGHTSIIALTNISEDINLVDVEGNKYGICNED